MDSFLFMKQFYEMRQSIGTIHNKTVYHPLEVSVYSDLKPKRDVKQVKDIVQDIEEKTILIVKKSDDPLLLPDTKVPDVSDVSDVPDVPAVSAVSDVPDVSAVSAVPDVPAVSAVSDVPDVSDVSDVPDVPDVPAVSDVSDVPDGELSKDVEKPKSMKPIDKDTPTDDIELLGGSSPDIKTISIKKDYVIEDK